MLTCEVAAAAAEAFLSFFSNCLIASSWAKSSFRPCARGGGGVRLRVYPRVQARLGF